jgi:hypothetical protein
MYVAEKRATDAAQYGARQAEIKSLAEQAGALRRQREGAELLPPQHLGRNTIVPLTERIESLDFLRANLQASLDADRAAHAAPFIAVAAERADLGRQIAGLQKQLNEISWLPPQHPAHGQVSSLEAELQIAREALLALG